MSDAVSWIGSLAGRRFRAAASVFTKLAVKNDDRLSGIAKRNRFDYRVSIHDRPPGIDAMWDAGRLVLVSLRWRVVKAQFKPFIVIVKGGTSPKAAPLRRGKG